MSVEEIIAIIAALTTAVTTIIGATFRKEIVCAVQKSKHRRRTKKNGKSNKESK